MISDTARFHGSFFILLFESLEEPVSVDRISTLGQGFYMLARRIPIYLKFSSKRRGPWTFTFNGRQQTAQNALLDSHGECFTCLICGSDGVVGLNMGDLSKVLDDSLEEQQSVSVRRPLRNMYCVSGKDGRLERRIGRNSIFEELETAIKVEQNP